MFHLQRVAWKSSSFLLQQVTQAAITVMCVNLPHKAFIRFTFKGPVKRGSVRAKQA